MDTRLPVRRAAILACELRRNLAVAAALAVALSVAVPLGAQEHAAPSSAPAAGEAHAPADAHAPAGEAHAQGEEHGGVLSGLLWPTANFIVMVAVLVYFLRTPLSSYFESRGTSIRKDLVDAAAVKAGAAEQLAAIEKKLQALPGEIEALRQRGAQEIAAEEQRIAAQAAAERDRLLAETRHEIDLQVRLAKRAMVEHASALALQLATDRLKKEISPADHAALVDRYLAQVKVTGGPSH